jgi:hypothetical protein
MKHNENVSCPICNRHYCCENIKTGHHIFPKFWYHGEGPKIPICRKCHDDFNYKNQMFKTVWTREECIDRLARFCRAKGKKMLRIYPQLESYVLV